VGVDVNPDKVASLNEGRSPIVEKGLDELAHRGRATVAQLERPPLRPTTVALEWTGRAQTLDALTATAETGGAALRVVGAANRDGAEVLTLAAPATIEWTPEWRVDAVRLDGPGGRLEVAIGAGPQRAFHIAARGLGKALINDWIAVEGPEWTVDSLDANGRTQDGALLFELAGAGNAAVERGRARIEISATGERDGVVVQRLTISDDAGVPLAQASGRVPVMGSSAPALQWRLLRDGQVELQAESRPGSALWPLLAARFGLRLEAPQARLRLEGTVERPQGSLEIDVSRLGRIAGEKESSLPEVENLALRARIERDGLVVESLAASIEGQAVRASARLPVAPHDWARLARKPADFDWREAEATLELPSADLGRLARSIPGFPLAQGRLTVTANLARGGRVTGSLRLVEGASRPLPPVGVLQNVTAEAELAGRAIELRELSAQLGGEAVTLRGRVDLTDFAAPRLALELAGRNVPLARKAGLLLRSDLALSARTDDAGRTRLAGTVELHDGLVLADLQQFIPTGVRGTERPPPYFAVEQAPFRDWTLDVAITGARGVRLHTPVATGFVSPRLRLEGTLGAPLAVGELNLESGRILLPFAGFEVQLGSVRLSREDPYHPQLNLAATSRRYGYDLRLEGRGSVGQPILTLSSVPALTSEQVWLLVMAGQRPDDTAGAAGLADRKRLTALGTYLGRGFFNGSGSDDPDRLTISSGEQLTQQGGETYLVEYLLGRRWSLVGEYDEFDDYNVGVKWRVYQTGGDDERR
ncbi:MAG TPA: translocation/assembly module TamB domain-containing protein, partial [Opitutaceae bacterium]|nr:translocation/assembly module TamB domain-containing protein [Opitutaceae bacterium]